MPVGRADASSDARGAPRAVHEGRGAAARVRWSDAAARDHGVRPGQTLAAAKVRCAGLISAPSEPAALRRAQRDVIAAMLELTPRVAPDGVGRFWAEPAPLGAAALGEATLGATTLGDVEAWCGEVRERLAAWGPVVIGVGPWAAVAHAAAASAERIAAPRSASRALPPAPSREREEKTDSCPGRGTVVVDDGHAFLDAQPLDALELSGDAASTLRTLGVRTVGALRRLDPVELGGRLGPDVARAWRRASGDDPRLPWTPRPDGAPCVEVALEHELDALEPLWFLLRPALARLLREPIGRGEGVVELTLALRRERGGERIVRARTAHAIGDPATLLELVRARLEAAPPPTGDDDDRDFVTGFSVTADTLAPLGERTGDLFGERSRDAGAREVARARIEARFGSDAVRRATRVETGSVLGRAAWARETVERGAAMPWRGQHPPAPLVNGSVEVAGRRRRLARLGRVERALDPWWRTGTIRVERLAWAEVDGPMLVLLRERRDVHPPSWEAVAWID